MTDKRHELEALRAEHKEAMRRIERTIEFIGDPQNPRHRDRTAEDVAYGVLEIVDPELDTDEKIDADLVVRGVSRYEDRMAERVAELESDNAQLRAAFIVAPHAKGCEWWFYQERPGSTERECTCWKSKIKETR